MTKCSYRDYIAVYLLKSHSIGAGGVCSLGCVDPASPTYKLSEKRLSQMVDRRMRATGYSNHLDYLDY